MCGFGVRDSNIDIICMQETIKSCFSASDLSSIGGSGRFIQKWLPTSGHSGGVLIGAKLDVFDFVACDSGSLVWFFATMISTVYGKLLVFMAQLIMLFLKFFWMSSLKISSSLHVLVCVGGGVNLMHSPANKNNANFSWSRVDSFNDFNR